MTDDRYTLMSPQQVADRLAFDAYMYDCAPSEREFEKKICPDHSRGVLSMSERLAFRSGFRAALKSMADAVVDQLSISPTEN